MSYYKLLQRFIIKVVFEKSGVSLKGRALDRESRGVWVRVLLSGQIQNK